MVRVSIKCNNTRFCLICQVSSRDVLELSHQTVLNPLDAAGLLWYYVKV